MAILADVEELEAFANVHVTQLSVRKACKTDAEVGSDPVWTRNATIPLLSNTMG